MKPLARWGPNLAVVHHVGRRTGRAFEVPVLLFTADDRYVIPLPYGKDRDWVRNVVAAGRFSMTHRGHEVRVVQPEVVADPGAVDGLGTAVESLVGWLHLEGLLVGDRDASSA
jgi:deazaflavin-dependent oxidoreductase (nitroreductase family)